MLAAEVAAPEVEGVAALFETHRGVGQQIERLREGVGLVPADAAGTPGSGAQDDVAEPLHARGNAPLAAQREGVFGRIGHAVAGVVVAAVVVADEAGVGVAVGGVEDQVVAGHDQ